MSQIRLPLIGSSSSADPWYDLPRGPDKICVFMLHEVIDAYSLGGMRFLQKRHGVRPIAPESLATTLCNRGSRLASAFERLALFMVDDFHVFSSSERAKAAY